MGEDSEFGDWMRNFYNKKAKNISKKGYEYARWFSSRKKRKQYKFSLKSLIFHLRDVDFKNCLEVGCGPGTWTKLLIERYPKAKFTCVELSKEMIKQFKNNTGKNNVKIVESGFLDYEDNRKYDFVFCSRAIEYIPKKNKVIDKFYNFLIPGGKGMIVSSPPHPLVFSIKKLFGKKMDREHTQRISVWELGLLLRRKGFRKIEFYPILFSDFALVPREFLFHRLYQKRWGLLSKMFASGYIVKFEKPVQ